MEDLNAPKDHYKLAYVIFYWLGTGSLLPWNFFITVNDYWMHKYRDVTVPDNNTTNGTTGYTDLQLQWNSYLSISSMIPNVLFLFINAFLGHKFRSQPRLLAALILIIVLFIFSDVMTKVDTDTWQIGFMGVTLFTVVIINIAVAIFQGGLSGLAGKFPPSYMGAVVQGQALGGIFAAGSNVVMLAMGNGAVVAAFADFLVAIIFLVTALIAFIVLTRTEFYRYYANESALTQNSDQVESGKNGENNKEVEQLIDEPTNGSGDPDLAIVNPGQSSLTKMSTWAIIKRIWIWILAVFVCFFGTLIVFPAITVLVKSTGSGNAWSDTYFIPVGCFLLFNVGDFVGRTLAGVIKINWATHFGSVCLLGLSLVKLAFVPLFLFCNAAPSNRSVTYVAIDSDVAYLIFMIIFSISNGYIGSVVMMFGPKMLQSGEDQGRAASLLVSFLVTGLAAGAFMSQLIVNLL